MSKVTKKELRQRCIDNETAIARLELILKENGIERKPQLKQLDQSVFEGVFDWVKSAAVNPDGSAYLFSVGKDDFYDISDEYGFQITGRGRCKCIGLGYDASNWKNSLIERDIAKELLEVDLSSELTGSDLARAMLANASKPIMCAVSDISTSQAMSLGNYDLIHDYTDEHSFMSLNQTWVYAVPINNQGEPLTASEVGL